MIYNEEPSHARTAPINSLFDYTQIVYVYIGTCLDDKRALDVQFAWRVKKVRGCISAASKLLHFVTPLQPAGSYDVKQTINKTRR